MRDGAVPEVLGGARTAPALSLGGLNLDYTQLADRIDRVPLPDGTGPLIAIGSDPADVVITCCAGLRAGVPVLTGDPSGPAPRLHVVPAGTALLLTTSGSTGTAKVIARTAASWYDSFPPFTTLTGLTSDDRLLLTGPLSSTLHLFGALHALYLGAALTDRPDDATAAHCVPAALAPALQRATSMRRVVVAGSALDPRLAEHTTAAGVQLVEYYGAAELSIVAGRLHPAPLRPFPGVEVTTDDGLIRVRSPYLSLGYAAGSGAFDLDDRGFATVGDHGRLLDGVLTVHGRGDTAITTAGHTVLAEEIESVLLTLPGIAAAAAVGLDHPRFGEIVAAVVELEPDADPAAIRRLARLRLPAPAVPRVWFRASLPRTPAGKIARAALRAALADGTLAGEPLSGDPAPARGSVVRAGNDTPTADALRRADPTDDHPPARTS